MPKQDKLELITTKLTPLALKLVRVIAAMTGEKQYQVLERVLKAELERVQNEQGQPTGQPMGKQGNSLP
ncbi:MAG: hypothetical protein WCS37_14360 [Chloroflexota bacterium]|nr:hypothetical protein [Chloroflexota bacterium]